MDLTFTAVFKVGKWADLTLNEKVCIVACQLVGIGVPRVHPLSGEVWRSAERFGLGLTIGEDSEDKGDRLKVID